MCVCLEFVARFSFYVVSGGSMMAFRTQTEALCAREGQRELLAITDGADAY